MNIANILRQSSRELPAKSVHIIPFSTSVFFLLLPSPTSKCASTTQSFLPFDPRAVPPISGSRQLCTFAPHNPKLRSFSSAHQRFPPGAYPFLFRILGCVMLQPSPPSASSARVRDGPVYGVCPSSFFFTASIPHTGKQSTFVLRALKNQAQKEVHTLLE